LAAFGEQSASVEQHHVLAVCRELRFLEILPKPSEAVKPAAPIPAAEAPAVDVFPMKTLARYETAAAKRSLLARLADRFRFMQRTEPA
jgi:hypothetical protein